MSAVFATSTGLVIACWVPIIILIFAQAIGSRYDPLVGGAGAALAYFTAGMLLSCIPIGVAEAVWSTLVFIFAPRIRSRGRLITY